MKDSKLRNATAILAKVIEVVGWFGVVMMIVTAIIMTRSAELFKEAAENGVVFTATKIGPNSVSNPASDWVVDAIMQGNAAFVFIPFAILLVITALIFRNVYLVFRKKNVESPFSPENIKRIRNIGILAIAMPISKAIMGVLFVIVTHTTNFMLSISLSEFVIGLVALCLTQYFAYGTQLEKDVDGLL
ncbi:MAG: DUF2975 domain-containing protein [Butyrivibrio sp.]|nr:DUF2975 domain-containing protein [Butyrivibrio sp.]